VVSRVGFTRAIGIAAIEDAADIEVTPNIEGAAGTGDFAARPPDIRAIRMVS
jgi:hypothetical protein